MKGFISLLAGHCGTNGFSPILSYHVENVKRYGTEEHWYTQSQSWSKGKGWLTHVKDSTEKKDSCTYHKPNVPES